MLAHRGPRGRRGGGGGVKQPSLSVVIPAYRAEGTLPALLASLESGSEGPDEVIVADDGTPGFTLPHCGDLAVRALSLLHGGPVAARNAGWRAAAGDLVAFLDSDCTVASGWCAALRTAAAEHPQAAVLEGPLRETYRGRFFRHWAENLRPGRYPTANVAYRRDVLAAVGGLDPAFRWGRFYFREDSDLALRALAHGRAVWVPGAGVEHHGRPIGFRRKLLEAVRYALDPALVARHGWRGLCVDGLRWRGLVLPAPRQVSAWAIVLLSLGGLLVPALWPLALAVWVARALFVVGREGFAPAELPLILAEQLLEPWVLVGAMVAGAGRLLRGPRLAEGVGVPRVD